ncbi:hypothetical protein BGW42_004431 [Actinomortierella wolfii]|nr:hypothetical protein BGW42_004431 [Actinomortierella wolfii]
MEGPPDLRVLIVGAGIGGLLLAILLDRAGITYQVIERATTFKPLGSSMSLPAAVQPLLEQLGLLDEINEVSKPERNICFYDQELTLMGTADALFSRERYGYYIRVMSRPALYSILLKRIPKDRITLSKRVIGVEQSDSRVTVRCADNSVYEADIVVGADGAYSAVRQNMYRDLAQKQQLPSADAKPMAFDQEVLQKGEKS